MDLQFLHQSGVDPARILVCGLDQAQIREGLRKLASALGPRVSDSACEGNLLVSFLQVV